MIQFKLLSPQSKLPMRATDGAAGFDLYATESCTIFPGAHVKIPTGVSCAIPHGWAGFIWPRSGLATKHGFDLLAGLVDSDFRGEMHVCGINHGQEAIEIMRGDRIAQLVVSPVMLDFKQVQHLDDTERGWGGFGSTGL